MPDHNRRLSEDAPRRSKISPVFAADAKTDRGNEEDETRHHWRKYKRTSKPKKVNS